jgi:hypothetical protein
MFDERRALGRRGMTDEIRLHGRAATVTADEVQRRSWNR